MSIIIKNHAYILLINHTPLTYKKILLSIFFSFWILQQEYRCEKFSFLNSFLLITVSHFHCHKGLFLIRIISDMLATLITLNSNLSLQNRFQCQNSWEVESQTWCNKEWRLFFVVKFFLFFHFLPRMSTYIFYLKCGKQSC